MRRRYSARRGRTGTAAGGYCTRDPPPHRLPVPGRGPGASAARCSRSPTAAVPTTPRSTAWRTPAPRSPTRWSWATPTSRPTCTPPATGCCSPSTTRSLDRVTDRTGPIAELGYGRGGRRRASAAPRQVPTLADAARGASRQARFNIDIKADAGRRAAGGPGAGAPAADDRVCVGSFSERRLARFRRASRSAGGDLGAARTAPPPSLLPAGRLAAALTRGRRPAGAAPARPRSRS